jgi:hypothetical protein
MTSDVLFKRLFAAMAALASLVALTGASQVIQRPAIYKGEPGNYTTAARVSPHIIHKRAPGKIQAGYFTNWSVMLALDM